MSETGLSPALCSRIEGFVARVQRETRIPGIGIAISIGGSRAIFAAGTRTAGRPDALTGAAQYHLGCITKLLLAALALELERSGLLDLRATIGEYVPELRGCVHGEAVRVEHLLSHTSGYRGTHLLDPCTRIESWSEFVEYLHHAPAMFPPGTVFSYEHTESALLGEIVCRVTGRDCLELIATHVLDALGIVPGELGARNDPRTAGFHCFDERAGSFMPLPAPVAVGRFWESAFSTFTVSLDDVLRVAEAVSGLAPRSNLRLAPSTRAALVTSVVRLPPTVSGPLGELLPVGFGLGTGELRDGCRGNTGISSGQCLGLRFDASAGVCVAVALNATAPHLRDFLLGAVSRELLGPRVATKPGPCELPLDAFTGTYLGPGGGAVRARYEAGRLVCEIGREHRPEKVFLELAVDSGGALVLRCPVPHVSIGFFAEPQSGARGLMLGLSAYRRVPD